MPKEDLPPAKLLLGFVVRYVQHGKRDSFTVPERLHQDFVVVYSMTQRVRRYAKAYVRLGHHDMATAGHPMVRAALEHAVTAQWVFYTTGGLNRYMVEVGRDRVALAREVAGLSEDDELMLRLIAEVPEGKGLQKWTQIRQALDRNDDFLGHAYRMLSQSVHVTHGAISDVVELNDDGRLFLRDWPEDKLRHQVLYVLAASCLLSWWLEAVCHVDSRLMQRLRENGAELKLPWSLAERIAEEDRRTDVD
ncbi:DUF5677 domain-containing protein [Microcella sp.]|uniref:DUF5677 domain-containing protein n=1 Tax=Microcella sp. TaxID=1913979 RepID=UPI0025667B60|nr:DUF5677 domain-containing protein [Microcella sp.]MBX9471283.1 hypothetical protein [Microcella sp.]